jgi:hypothetical protein
MKKLGYILGEGPPGKQATQAIMAMRHNSLVGGKLGGYVDMYDILSALISGEHPLASMIKEYKTDVFVLPEYHEDLVGRLLLRNEPSDIAVWVVEDSEEVKLWGYYHPTDN